MSGPTISNVSPSPSFSIDPSTPLQFTITSSNTIVILAVAVVIDPNGAPELVYDGTVFSPLYKENSSIATVTGPPAGFTVTFRRQNGWPAPPTLRVWCADNTGAFLVE
jgi:hypothetical protein